MALCPSCAHVYTQYCPRRRATHTHTQERVLMKRKLIFVISFTGYTVNTITGRSSREDQACRGTTQVISLCSLILRAPPALLVVWVYSRWRGGVKHGCSPSGAGREAVGRVGKAARVARVPVDLARPLAVVDARGGERHHRRGVDLNVRAPDAAACVRGWRVPSA